MFHRSKRRKSKQKTVQLPLMEYQLLLDLGKVGALYTGQRYVVAFAGNGAKDVTRRYCTKWYKIASERVNSIWWDSMAPHDRKLMQNSFTATRSSLEDMELETRALTEPLPTNQQAYRNHHLYIIERWLNKYQILYPKGPVLGFCSGHPVYPMILCTNTPKKGTMASRGLQVKANEIPAKVLKLFGKQNKGRRC
ncbi:hypothetical protein HAX54_012999 [Datura stramonium]|uniref:Rad4 beta-hairpin domain-containing protein n=1 Tax=Datura stramonium TaxID=4076 RepID=A0ABS8RYL8_DATST|nr:hypothetical protein [Datura stramonium]